MSDNHFPMSLDGNFPEPVMAQSLIAVSHSNSVGDSFNTSIRRVLMADEKSTNQNQQNQPEQGKAMGAAANAGPGQDRQTNSPSETAGQGGGIQGSGQSQQNPGGYSEGGEGSRDDSQSNQGADRRPDPTQGE
jgi:hypothetical protein